MRQVQIPNFNYTGIQWIESDNPKYEKRSQEAYPYCVDCKENHYVYHNHPTRQCLPVNL